MGALYGHTWASQYGTSPTGIGADTWRTALTGVGPAQIANGMREALAQGGDFPPSAPRFRAMCFGIPSLAAVKYTLRNNEHDRFVVLLNTFLDRFAFARADQRRADAMLKEAYELAREYVMRCGALPAEPVAVIEQAKPEKPVRAPEHVARPYVESLAALLGDDPRQTDETEHA